MSRNRVIVLPQGSVKSAVWISLGGTSKAVYLIFRCKCQYAKMKGKHSRLVRTNDGELVFTYAEALQDYGITKSRFVRAIDELLAKGFIDIAETGMGVYKATTLYGISDRWIDYGTDKFKTAKRSKPSVPNPGFKRGHKRFTKTKTSIVRDTGAGNEIDTGEIIASYTNDTGEKVSTLYKRSGGIWLSLKTA